MIMKLSNFAAKCIVCLVLLVSVVAGEPVAKGDSIAAADTDTVYFVPVAVYIDSGDNSLGVYQIEIKAIVGDAKIVGVEGGEHKAFKEPPYYDTAAMMQNRIILATFCTQNDLPTGRTKVATLHMQVTGDVLPEYEVIVNVVGDSAGEAIDATVTVE
jgi:hypothetical protein